MPDKAPDLVGLFLSEHDLTKRVELTRMALDGLTPDEATSLLFAALNVAVDHLAAVTQAAHSRLGAQFLLDELQARTDRRSSDYIEYEFRRIVEG